MAKRKPSPPAPGFGSTEAESRAYWRAQGPGNDRSWCEKHQCDKHLDGGGPGPFWICPKCWKEDAAKARSVADFAAFAQRNEWLRNGPRDIVDAAIWAAYLRPLEREEEKRP